MQAALIERAGGPEVVQVKEVAEPLPGVGEVVVSLRFAALNHRDVWIRKGMYAAVRYPAIVGSDGTGQIVAVGPGGDSSLMGRHVLINPGWGWGADLAVPGPHFRVLGMPDDGTHAERIRVPTSEVRQCPDHLDAREAAAIPLAGLTAFRALTTRAGLRSGQTLLITGIGGGVSSFALQIALAIGARAFVTSGRDEKIARAVAMGASGGVNYRSDDWAREVVRLCGGEGPEVVLDSIGGETFARCLQIVRKGGRIVTYGATTGPTERLELTRLFWKQVDILGTTMGSSAEFSALRFYGEHRLKPVIDRVYPLAEVVEAHRHMEEAGQFGKILLSMGSD